jgi:hypothetical protein
VKKYNKPMKNVWCLNHQGKGTPFWTMKGHLMKNKNV